MRAAWLIGAGCCAIAAAPHTAGAKSIPPSRIFTASSPAVVVTTTSMQGSGFIFDRAGRIVTNCHVIAGAQSIDVTLKDGRTLPATGVLAFDADNDVCVITVDADGLPVLAVGESQALSPGEPVFTIGAPLGLDYTISDGLFSGRRTLFGQEVLQFSAPLSAGSSGGPLLNAQGRVVGITSAIHRGGQNVNFAVPVEALIAVLKQGGGLMTVPGFATVLSPSYYAEKKAWAHAVAGDWDSAVEMIQEAISKNPQSAYAYALLGDYFMTQEKFDESVVAYQKARKFDPQSSLIRSGLAKAYRSIGLLDEAVFESQKAIALDPSNADGHSVLGGTLYEQGAYPDAVVAFRNAAALNPQDAFSRTDLCFSYNQMGLSNEALQVCQEAVALSPTYVLAHFGLGQAYGLKGLPEEAIAAYLRSLEADPSYSYSCLELARLYHQTGQIELAKTYAHRAQQLGLEGHTELVALLEALQQL